MKASKERQVSSTRTGPPTCRERNYQLLCTRFSTFIRSRSRFIASVLFTELSLVWCPASHSRPFLYWEGCVADLVECSGVPIETWKSTTFFFTSSSSYPLLTFRSSIRLSPFPSRPDMSSNSRCTSLPITNPQKVTRSPPSLPTLLHCFQ